MGPSSGRRWWRSAADASGSWSTPQRRLTSSAPPTPSLSRCSLTTGKAPRLCALPKWHAAPERRHGPGGPYKTDNGNYLLDLYFPNGIADPGLVAARLTAIAGVLGHGLFLGLATAALVFDHGTVRVLGDLDQERIS